MAIIGRFAKAVGKRLAKKGARKTVKKAMSSKQKLALMKAVKASARKRKKSGLTSSIKKLSKTNRLKRRVSAIKKSDKLNLKRVVKGTRGYEGQKRISNSLNFSGAGGAVKKRATYKARLASSRAKYKNSDFGDRAIQKIMGVGLPTQGIWRRKYVDLTVGENVRRNFSRNVKVAAATLGTAYGVMAAPQIKKELSATADKIKSKLEKKYKS